MADHATAHTGALAILFPESGKVSREKFRYKFDRDTRALLQMLTMSWPSTDIRTRMESDDELDDFFYFIYRLNSSDCLTLSYCLTAMIHECDSQVFVDCTMI